MLKSLRDPAFLAGLSFAFFFIFLIWRLEATDPSTLAKSVLSFGMGVMAMCFVLNLEHMIRRIHNTPPSMLRDYFRD